VSWHYSQGQGVASWEGSSLDGAPSALLSSIPTAETSSLPDNARDTWNPSQSGTTSEPSTAPPGGGQLTLFPVASPAKTSVRQVPAKDLPGTVQAFSLKCSESLKRCGLGLYSRRTRRICVPVDLAPSSKDLPGWGMTHDGVCWELGTRVLITEEIACGYYPTPTAQRYGSNGPGERWKEFLGSGKKRRGSLETIVGGTNLPLREWMMGWPIGWTGLELLETDRFRQWLRSHGGC
jgi:hypothetical protein